MQSLEDRAHEPIAIVGMACRYPGGIASPADLWRLVAEQRDAIAEFPTDRGWDLERLYHPDPDNPGTSYTREGGFLAGVGEFDPAFFAISPREAEAMDPQERLLLESCWEALEDAGIDPVGLKRSATGVFAGVGDRSYGPVPGMTSSIVSGRISYALGLEGPALSIDTACSSSLVAMHLASQALRQGECTLALAGGVAVLSTPTPFLAFSAQRGLAPDGRSKSFADAADGVAWAEGVGVLILERLADAQRNGHPVLALLRGSAVNQDGASNGLTAPNGPSQERVIRQALANARLSPKDVDVVEGHGTGTTLGDPIEARALLATYGQERDKPLRLGSIKSNIGHTQAAAGVAGVIKMTEAMRRGVMPKTLHVDAPSSKVDWEAGDIELLTEQLDWEPNGGPRRAGVSSFGISGTNAHVILEQAPEVEGETTATVPIDGPVPLALSAKTEPALAEAAERLATHIEADPDLGPADLAYSLITTRSAFEHRAVALGGDKEELLAVLNALANGTSSPNVLAAKAKQGKLAYLFTGQGSQRLGMGRELYEADANFREAFDAICEQLDRHLDTPLKEIVFAKGKKAAALLEDTTYAQPALFAIEVALYRALAERGLTPDVLTGHSIGEIAAAHIAGVLDLSDAAKLVAARGRLMGALPEGGAMAAIEATEAEVSESIEGKEKELAIAAINGPTSTVISGTEEAVQEIQAQWDEKGRKTKRLSVSHAFHSPLMEPMLEQFAEVADSLTYSEPEIPLVSNVTGELLTPEQAQDPSYWVSHAREPVRFADAIATLKAQGTTTYLELGPDPVLCAMARECLGKEQDKAAFIPTLREGRTEAEAITTAIASAHVSGAKLDWGAFFAGTGAKRVPLPTYPFQRKRYWLTPPTSAGDAGAIGLTATDHPLLGASVELADGTDGALLLTGRLSLSTHPWLAEHLAEDAVLLPGAAFLELALRAAEQAGAQSIEELSLKAPLALTEAGAVAIQVSVSGPDEDGRREIAIHSSPEGEEEEWALNASGVLSERPLPTPEHLASEPAQGDRHPTEVSLLEEQADEAHRFAVHPALLEMALREAGLTKQDGAGSELIASWQGVALHSSGASTLRLLLTQEGETPGLIAYDPAGEPVLSATSVTTRALEPGELSSAQRSRVLYEVQWKQAQTKEGSAETGQEVLEIAPPKGDVPEAAQKAAEQALAQLQAWVADPAKEGSRLTLLTHNAIATKAGEAPDLTTAALWGLVRSAISEHPGRFAVIDTDASEASKEALPAALALGGAEPQLALRDGEALVPRLAKVKAGQGQTTEPFDPERTVLIGGATGDLGALVARHLSEHHGLHHLVLVDDVSDREALEEHLAQVPKDHPLGAVIHCAGTIDGAWSLHELTKDVGLSAFALLSPPAGTFGAPGQGSQAAAGVFLDGLAQKRRAEGLVGASVAWEQESELELLDAAIAADRPAALAVPLDPARLMTLATAGVLEPIFSELVSAPRRRAAATGSLGAKLATLPEPEHGAYVFELVRGEVASVLGHSSAAEVEGEKAFKELGFDSLAAVELRNRLSEASGLSLAASVVFDYPSPATLAEHVLAEATAAGVARQDAVRARASEEPIAIVGMACRFPGGVESPEDMWELVAEGRDGVTEFPADRGWDLERIYDPDPEHQGTTYTREGGFLADAAEFDAEFFGISPREALGMDPQERLLLESCWESLEDAGIDPASLRRSQTGVFAGVAFQDYGSFVGMASSIVSGRVSYALGLEGPAMTINTACSSSLVAIHLASQALRQGECTLALAGGVTVLSTPTSFIAFSAQGGLAPDGRSKSFAEAADGAGWAEGVGVVALERLSEARRNGHRVLAVLRGSAVNQDGASNGLTAPNGPSQERVIRQALANANLTPQEIDAVEAHGTGTVLGDPIEAGALLATYGQERDEPLRLGSIKSNIGHTQAAAGVAGVIKMALAMREGVLPRTLHVDAPSSKVDWEAGEIELLSEAQQWEPNGRPRRAGVSSFGISGTNAHVILEQAQEAEPAAQDPAIEPPKGQIPLALSAKAEPALAEVANRLAAHLQGNPDLDPTDVAYSLVTTRSSFEYRVMALGKDREELLASLSALANGAPSPNLLAGKARQGKLAYLLTGQGSQRLGMGKELYEADQSFAKAFDQLCEQLDQHLKTPLKEIVFAKGKKAAALLEDTTYAQPALFAIEVALYEALAGKGLKPDALTGHSIGEIAAAHIAGVLDLSDAAKLITARGALMGALPGGGAMAAIEATEQEVSDSIEGKEKDLALAAVNGPTSTVISGTEDAVKEIQAQWESKGKKTKRLSVSHAFHSPLMEPMLEQFAEVADSLTYSEPEIPLVSNVTGELLTQEQATDPSYWVSHAREPVRFADAIATLKAQGTTTYLELGPDPVLCAMARECLGEEQDKATFIPTLREGRTEAEAITTAIATAHISGAKLDWGAFFAGTGAKRVPLPTYPFQRERYWLDSSQSGAGDLTAAGQSAADHPLLGAAVELADAEGGGLLLTGRLSLATHSWLADHQIGGVALLPGAAFLELALRAADQVEAAGVEELTLGAPLVLPQRGAVAIQVSVSGPDEEGRRDISIHSRPEAEEEETWTLNASGSLSERAFGLAEPLDAWPPEGAEAIEVADLHDRLADAGLEYGPIFQGLSAAWRQGERIYAEISLPEESAEQAQGFGIHPALLDAALQGVELAGSGEVELPASWRGVALQAVGAGQLRLRIAPAGEAFSLSIADAAGAPVASIEEVVTSPLDLGQLAQGSRRRRGLLGIEWVETGVAGKDAKPPHGELLHCRVDGDAPPAVAARKAAQEALEEIQRWLADESRADSRLTLITTGAMAAAQGDSPDPAAAAIWGLIRSAQSEHPGRFALIDSDGTEASRQALGAALAIGGEEPQLALRAGRPLAPRIARMKAGEVEEQGEPIDPERTVLIAGATGALGALVSRHLVERHGARHLLLVSRRGPEAAGAVELRQELEALGAKATIAACDVSDRAALKKLLASISDEHPLGVVVHCAGAIDDGTIETLSAEQVEHVFTPKVDAAWNLHELTRDADLSAFVLFSSVAGTLGGPGQGNYAAANVFLDSLAQRRQAEGLVATAIAWGLWEREGGMISGLGEADLARMRRGGVGTLSDERGLELFDAALGAGRPQALAVPIEVAGLRALASVGVLPPIFGGLVRIPKRRSGAASSLATTLATMPGEEHEGFVLELVRGTVAAVLGHGSAQEVEPDKAFQDLGFDSLAAVELRNVLDAIAGLRLAATVVFDYPSSAALAEHLLAEATAGGAAKQVVVRAQASEEPIAIVGMACRFPGGVNSPAELWRLVSEGRDGVTEFPADRGWDLERIYDPDPEHQGTTYTREGGFLAEAGEFDADFFAISPREALGMDPQERLLLESCWESLEDAGIDPDSLRRSQTGVFAGVAFQDYGAFVGMASSIVSGRVSYTLGLEGPAMTINTACSSSLVAMHLASQALRQGECTLALAGGVTVLSTPSSFIAFSAQGGLAPDGRCKSFAEAADGTGWAEGVGMVVLERLSDARRNNHPVLALLKGSAVNQDGASNGLTAPNGPSQERVIRQALANARLTPQDIDAVEAHGTGTTLGDPIEAGALLATYGQERDRPLRLGSIKSNIGHTQAAAGVAGVIKMTEAMRRGVMPKTLHIDAPSSKADWEAGDIELLTEQLDWEPNGGPRRAGVSSFGISGTNAHVILEQAPEAEGEATATEPIDGPVPLALSAKTEPALTDAAERLITHIEASPDTDPTDLAYSLITTRSSFEHRAIALGGNREELLTSLEALANGTPSPNLLSAKAKQGKLAYLLTGQGSQRLGMGKELYEADLGFAKAFDRLCEQLDQHLKTPLKQIVFAKGKKAEALLEDTTYAQPALFAIEVALYEALASKGLKPDALTGHSIGEIAAAHIAGVLDLPDAAKLISARGALMGALPKGGAMAAIEATEAEVTESIKGKGKELAIAAVNGPTSTVISGTEEAVEEIQAQWDEKGRKTKRLSVSHAFHSPLMEPMLEQFAEVANSLTYHEPKLPLISNLTGEPLTPEQAQDPSYWVTHAREPVRFADAIATLKAQGTTTYLELGPDPVLCAMARECLGEEQDKAAFIPTLREGRAEAEAITTAIAGAHVSGASIDWGAFFKGTGAKRVPLPTYPFQRERYWLVPSVDSGDASAIGQSNPRHPLLAAAIDDPGDGSLTLTGRLSLHTHPWLAGHVVGDAVLLPGTAFLELALRAAEEVGAKTVEELTLQAPLVLPEVGAVAIQVSVSGPDEEGRRELSIHSRLDVGTEEELAEAPEWVCHAQGSLSTEPSASPERLDAWPPENAEPLEVEFFYDLLAEAGLQYGPAFQGLRAAWREGEQIYAEVSLPEGSTQEAERFAIHPALLDSALHGIALAGSVAEPKLPFSWSEVCLHSEGASELRVRLSSAGGRVALQVADGSGAPVASVGSLVLRPLDLSGVKSPAQPAKGLLAIEWAKATLPEAAKAPTDTEPLHCQADPKLPSPKAAQKATEEALAAIQQWLADESKADLRLALITEGAMATSKEESPDPATAAIWGLIRSAQSEHPGRFALIDSDGSEASEQALPQALTLSAEEPQLALRQGEALAPRALPAKDTEDSLIPPAGPWRLDALKRGTLESLALTPSPLEPLGPTAVRIQMAAAGLNFRDVLIALGIYPGEAAIGSEGAGVVVEVGSEVSDLTPGDRVMGLIADAFGPTATTERDLLTKVPEGWSLKQAAAMPIVFATAFYGLNDLAQLKAGERVLIHAGAGGVGQAAIGIARHIGAEVFATASPAKWEVLRAAGLDEDHIASSRDLEFKDKFLTTTQSKGMDVVLNALAGEFIDASLALLPNGGRFLEMGKTDIRDKEQLQEEHKGLTYLPFDVTEAGPKRTGEILTEVASLIEQGALQHSPITSWDMRSAPVAFRHLREGNNVGKVVLTLPEPIDPKRTTLITGATGGLGALIARHLVKEQKAEHLLLVSRSGPEAKGAKELQQELQDQGAEVQIKACDVSDPKALGKLLDQVPDEHPLGAVIHCAGVLADATVETLSKEQIEQVFAPKATAAHNLHELTKEADLSAFVLFSSAAGTLGGPGQGNYAAANVFLDALAQKREAEGLPATSIAWGLWQREGGMISGLGEADVARMRRGGFEPIADEQGLALFDAAIGADRPGALALPIETAGLKAAASVGALPPILSGLVRTPKRRSASSGSLATTLASLPEAEHEAYVLELVRGSVAAILGHSSAQEIEPNRAFQDLGFDSLAAVELRNALDAISGLRLSATVVFDYPSSTALAEHLLAEATASGAAKQITLRAQASDEPIAIVGMACRYPGGVSSPEELWQLVAEGKDAITEFPTDRGWDIERLYDPDPESPGTSYTREGGFLADAGEFDPDFFSISPREALVMDPQERLLLESSWEALEDAGIDPASLRRSQTGVFAGVGDRAYGPVAGITSSIVSGRVSYALGLEGPAISIDTACSSALVAMHLAAGALRQGECTLALAGGVTVMSTPTAFVAFSAQGGLAPDGRCKPFADGADGTAWSEGVGVVLLERLSDAKGNNHPVLALLKGSAVNQDGASNGLTAPNGPSQERVIRQALANARLTPQDIDAVEAHGTGTTLGDPIEAGALLATYGQERDRPLRLGSIKSNIGHTQAAAGVAGVIKMTEAMRRGVLPKSLHIDAPSSKVDWEAGEIELLSEAQQWESNGEPRRVGVSSFSISGTNAHLILEQAPAAEQAPITEPPDGLIPLALSAKTEPALADAAGRLAAQLRESPELDLTDAAYSLITTRSAFEHRAIALGSGRDQLLEVLQALSSGESSPNLLTAKAKQGKLAYLLTGQGSQRLGMGKELYEADLGFAKAFDRLCEQLDQHLKTPLKQIVFAKGKKAEALLEDTTYAQPALFAIEVALYRALAERGLTPDVLTGHSIGEIAAAHIAGVLDLSDAARLITARGALMGALPGGGAMAAIEATEQEVSDSIKGKAKELAIAAVNGPTSTVISGTEDAVKEIQSQWEGKGRKTKRLSVSHAFHSPLMEPMLEQFAEVANSLTYSEPKIPLISNLTGEPLSKEQATDPAYWVSHAREPVRFADAIATLKAQGTTTYLELGPDPVLCAMARECLGEEQDRAAFIPTLREGRTEAEAITTAIGNAHVSGAKLDWGAFFKGTGAKRVPLPTYPFQRERYWFGGEESATAALHKVSWQEIAKPTTEATEQEVLEIAPVKGDVPEAAQKAAEQALAQLQAWIAEEANEGSRLTLLTHNAIATKEGEAPDLTTAAVWGLVRSAISEHPGRFAVIDTDRSEASTEALPAALALGAQEPQIALRDGEALAPRLAKLRAGDQEPTTEPLDPQSTVLITGGLLRPRRPGCPPPDDHQPGKAPAPAQQERDQGNGSKGAKGRAQGAGGRGPGSRL